VGGTDPARSAGKKFFGRAPPLFGSKSTISRFGEYFRDDQYSLVSLLFAVLLLTVPSVPHGVGATGHTCKTVQHNSVVRVSCITLVFSVSTFDLILIISR